VTLTTFDNLVRIEPGIHMPFISGVSWLDRQPVNTKLWYP